MRQKERVELMRRAWARVGLLLAVVLLVAGCSPRPALGITAAMNNETFWQNKLSQPDAELLTAEEIAAYNRLQYKAQDTGLCDLAAHPQQLSKQELLALLRETPFPSETRYTHTRGWTEADYGALLANMDLDSVSGARFVGYGFAVQRARLRAFPTDLPSQGSLKDVDFDLFALSLLPVWEPLLLLHVSLDGAWTFVQAPSCRGWVPTESVAAVDSRSEFLDYLQPEACLYVTANHLQVGRAALSMGTRLPLSESLQGDQYRVNLPLRGANGRLELQEVTVALSEDVSLGPLPLTRRNLLHQAFRCLGDPYGWGGQNGHRDCSGLLQDIYRSFGVLLPRNSAGQSHALGETWVFANHTQAENLDWLSHMPPGTLVTLPGHVVFYLGMHNGQPYVLHAVYALGNVDREGRPLTRDRINSVVVSSMEVRVKSGATFLEAAEMGVFPALP